MPPLAGPRLMVCCTRQPVNTRTDPSSMRTRKWTGSSRLTSRRPRRASSESPITSAAASNRRWAVWKAEARVSTAISGPPILLLALEVAALKAGQWAQMSRQQVLGILGGAAGALGTGFLVAGQVQGQLLTPSNT